MTKTKTLKNGKIQYFYNEKLLRTSAHTYKYALIKENEYGIFVKKFSNSLATINSEFNYLTKGYGLNESDAIRYLASSQFNNPKDFKILTF